MDASRLSVLFVVNLLVAFIWIVFAGDLAWFNLLVGFVLGFVLLSIYNREYGLRSLRLVGFILYVLWEIVLSNVRLAWTIVQPGARMEARLDPGIIAVPLDVTDPLEITVLATVITLTPGTLSLDLGRDEAGRQVLYIHELNVKDAEAFRRDIKHNFERRLLQITKGTAT